MSNSNTSTIAPLPFPENLALKYLVAPYYLSKYDLAFANSDYDKMVKIIVRVAKLVNPEELKQKIKIKRFFGIEEVSTNWSLGMTLEHLTLVGEGFMRIISDLNKEGKSAVVADPAKVKPQGQIEDPISLFVDHIQKYQEFITGLDFKKNANSKCLHPWVGELNQKDWHFFTVMHLQVHLRQIIKIFNQLKPHQTY